MLEGNELALKPLDLGREHISLRTLGSGALLYPGLLTLRIRLRQEVNILLQLESDQLAWLPIG